MRRDYTVNVVSKRVNKIEVNFFCNKIKLFCKKIFGEDSDGVEICLFDLCQFKKMVTTPPKEFIYFLQVYVL